MPLNANIISQTKYIKDKETICLTEDQARHIYKKEETGKVINIDIIKEEIQEEVDKMDDTNGEINPYCVIIVNKAERDNTILSQMEQWSIFSNVIKYMQYDKHPRNFYNLDIKAIDKKVIRRYIIKKGKDKY